MKSNPELLKNLSSSFFSEDLAKDVITQIDKEAADHLTREPADPYKTSTKSIATLFLADLLYGKLETGRFEGLPIVQWNGFDPKTNSPSFVFIPDPDKPFRYITSENRIITPKKMDTDGGTIPRVLHGISKFSPWWYAPGYIIYDWIFVAHKSGVEPDNDISFEDSALLLAESLKTLMEDGFTNYDGQQQKFEKAEDTLYLIHKAVKSSFAKNLWDNISNVNSRA